MHLPVVTVRQPKEAIKEDHLGEVEKCLLGNIQGPKFHLLEAKAVSGDDMTNHLPLAQKSVS